MIGGARKRPELDGLLDQFRSGDVIVVTKYDRLARSLRDLLDIVEAISARGAGFRSLAEDIDTTTPTGRLIVHVFASIVQFERERISERTKEGLEAARRRGHVGSRRLPCHPISATKCIGCVTMKAARSPKSPACSGSLQIVRRA